MWITAIVVNDVTNFASTAIHHPVMAVKGEFIAKRGREGGRKGGRERGREGEGEEGREGEREGGREGEREGGSEEGREGGREGGRGRLFDK